MPTIYNVLTKYIIIHLHIYTKYIHMQTLTYLKAVPVFTLELCCWLSSSPSLYSENNAIHLPPPDT